jgi:uncharacterized LabA/DUF88 family protein
MDMLKDNNNYAYIDGANLHKGTVELGWMIDYDKFFTWLKDKYDIKVAYMFIGNVSKYASLYEKMKNAGFTLIFKDVTNNRYGQIKGNCDADLVLQAARDVFEKEYGNAIIVSSDGDFSGLVRFLQEKGKMESVLSPSNRCSIFLLRTGAPLTYLDQVKEKIMLL